MTSTTTSTASDLTHDELVVISDVMRRVLDGAQTGEFAHLKAASNFTFKPEFTSALEKVDAALLDAGPARVPMIGPYSGA